MRRQAALLLMTMAAALVLASGVALADNIRCKARVVCNGTNGNDRLTGTGLHDIIKGRGGGDTLRGLGRNDDLWGQAGNDRLVGGEGGDALDGGSGDDTLEAGSNLSNQSVTYFDGYRFASGWGDDIISDPDPGVIVFVRPKFENSGGEAVTTDLTVNLAPGQGAEVTDGKNTVNWTEPGTIFWVEGGAGNDEITGDDAANILEGSEGNDTINGGAGDDIQGGMGYLMGGPGNDTLNGGTGRDTVFGNAGDDTISAADGERDEVDCGEGNDEVTFDEGVDWVNRCEVQNGS